MIKAQFIGKTSCGFESRKCYQLESKVIHNYIYVFDLHSNARCPYTNLDTFLANWRILK